MRHVNVHISPTSTTALHDGDLVPNHLLIANTNENYTCNIISMNNDALRRCINK
uniref:Uncharacterized protein n=1 Tax=Anguilla anguilla TaxID=7936 RepID=A0A0E9R7L5_ANGAN